MVRFGIVEARGYGTVAACDLPKVETGVRFPLPALVDSCWPMIYTDGIDTCAILVGLIVSTSIYAKVSYYL